MRDEASLPDDRRRRGASSSLIPHPSSLATQVVLKRPITFLLLLTTTVLIVTLTVVIAGKSYMKIDPIPFEDLRHLVKSYSEPDTMQRFMATAKATPEQNVVQLKAYDVIQSGDSMTIWLDMISKKQRRVEIQTSMNEKPVKIVSEFQGIGPSGPTYMSRNQVNYSGTSLVIITQNFDYTLSKQSESAALNQ